MRTERLLGRRVGWVSIVTLLVAFLWGPTGTHAHAESSQPDDRVRILSYGDSITAGSGGDHTWRYFLDRHLTAVGQPFDLVGPLRSVHTLSGRPWSHQYADPDFDQDHAGYWGGSLSWPVRSGPIDPGAAVLVREHSPDVAVVAVGSNDIGFFGIPPEQTVELLRDWVLEARAVSPDLAVVLVESTLSERDGYAAFNALLPELVDELNLPAAPAALARAADGFVPSTLLMRSGDTWDAKHPNSAGAQKIAAAVADALASLGVGEEYPRPLPSTSEGPHQPVTVRVREPGPDAELEWTVPDGATEVRLQRLVLSSDDPDEETWINAGLDFSTFTPSSTTVKGVPACTVQRFRARALKQWTLADISHVSEIVEWVPTPVEAPVPAFFHVRGTTSVSWRPVPGACTYGITLTHTSPEGSIATEEVEVSTHTVEFPTPSVGADVLVEVVPQGLASAGPSGSLRVIGPTWPTPATPGPSVPVQSLPQPSSEGPGGSVPRPVPGHPGSLQPSQPPLSGPGVPRETSPGARPSQSPSARPAVSPPRRVQGLHVAQRARKGVLLRWSRDSSARTHRVQVKRPGHPWRTVKVSTRSTAGSVTARVKGLRPGARYSVRVGSRSRGEFGAWSVVKTFRTRP